MPAVAVPAAISAGTAIYGGIKAHKDKKSAEKKSAQKLTDDRTLRMNTLQQMLGGGGQGTGLTGIPKSPYNQNWNPYAGGGNAPSEPSDVHAMDASAPGGRTERGNGTYYQEGDESGMFHNANGSWDWDAGSGPKFLKNSPQYRTTGQRPIGRRPPDPDAVDPSRGPDWRIAEEKNQAWIKQNLDSGRTLRDLGLDPTKGGGMSNYMKWGSYQADPNAAPPSDPGRRYNLPPGENGGGGRRYNLPPGENPEMSPPDYGGGGQSDLGGMYDYAGPEDVYGNSETGGDYGLASMYQRLLGNSAQSQSFLAPQTQALQEQKDGQVKSIIATIPPGGQRDRALAQLNKSFNQSLSGLRQGLLTSSMSGLQGLYGTQLGDATQRYGIDTGAETSRYATDAQSAAANGQLGLGYANLGQRGYEYDTGLDWQKNQFGQNFGLEKAKYLTGADQFDEGFNRQQDWRNQDQSNSQWGQVGNTLSGLASAYLNNRSAGGTPKQNRVKFNYGAAGKPPTPYGYG